jgi:hypothetical protein
MMSNRIPPAICRATLAALLSFLAACVPQLPPRPPTKSVDYYKSHPNEMEWILNHCGEFAWPSDEQPCRNAAEAKFGP